MKKKTTRIVLKGPDIKAMKLIREQEWYCGKTNTANELYKYIYNKYPVSYSVAIQIAIQFVTRYKTYTVYDNYDHFMRDYMIPKTEHQIYSLQFLSDQYDKLCGMMEQVIKRNNPCNIKVDGTTNCITCAGQRSTEALCCEGFKPADIPRCKHWKSNGCSVKSLRCKTWFCYETSDKLPIDSHRYEVYDYCRTTSKYLGLESRAFMGHSDSPVFDEQHNFIINEMVKYRFHRYWREGKTKTVQASYNYFKSLHKKKEINE